MLTFISFWRAAAIVLSDLASSAYYVGGDAEKVIGKSAPWFVLAVMLFSYAVRAVYIESSAMFVRGGVYRVVKQALGGTLAKLSVSALLFDYVLTGPISSVAAGQYLAGFLDRHVAPPRLRQLSRARQPVRGVVCGRSDDLLLVAEYQGHSRVQRTRPADHEDHHGDGGDADRLVPDYDLSSMALICRRFLPRRPSRATGNRWAGCWAPGPPSIPLILMMVGFGHSVLAMSGEESLAQVNREIEHPKLKNLEKDRAGDLRSTACSLPRWCRSSR